jgi:hypothetical protein
MPRPTKRAVASRHSAQSPILGKRQRLSDSEASDILSDSESPSDSEEQIAVSEAEDSGSESEGEREQDLATVRLPIAQPDGGWKSAEQTLQGYSKTNAGKTKQSRYYYNKRKRKRKEKRRNCISLMATFAAFDSVRLRTIRRFADRSKRWMMAYINGLTAEQREYAEKQYKSHRRAGRDVFV